MKRTYRIGAAVAALCLLVLAVAPTGASAGTVHVVKPTAAPYRNITYNSSVDGFPLSYIEWSPSNFRSNVSYPLFVFLHGIGTSTTWTRGGVGALVDVLPGGPLVTSVVGYGFLISINTRSATGFYTNTPCGGPQEQDVLDAIAHEEALRNVSAVYLVGFSMGSMGAFSIAADHPGLVSGIATVGTITDAFETYAYDLAHKTASTAWRSDLCLPQNAPVTNASLDALFLHLSPVRFHPTDFAGIPLYVTAGAWDQRAPNNYSRWAYANGNSTFVNASCVRTSYEPANCTVTFGSLAALNASAYNFRFVWEPYGQHVPQDLPAADAVAFLMGKEAGGYYTSSATGTSIVYQGPA